MKSKGLIFYIFFVITVFGISSLNIVNADRLKDISGIGGVRSNQLVGYGIVVGLVGSGDGNVGLTLQSMQSLVSRFGLAVNPGDLDGKNSAAVMVTADLNAFSKPGQKFDVTVSAMGKAKSLRGGTLLMTPLRGSDGEVYAIAQGNVVVGGLGVEGNDGSSLSVNIPTAGRVPSGATVERMVDTPLGSEDFIVLNLMTPDFTTVKRVADSINEVFEDPSMANAIDSTSVRVRAPADRSQRVAFMSIIENIEVDPAQPAAKVVVNSRTGTIVMGGKVRVTPAAVTHGNLTVRVDEDFDVSQPPGGGINAPGETVVTADTDITVEEEPARAFVFDPGIDLADLVDQINAVGSTPSDLIAILEALREAGALRAELIII
ncbi:MAG: flagellar biosynthesis protein FlgI [Rhodospirillaceae bacterium]|nr:flagellar biosynthesis protein FlgI [Rhodospirillaceae bacterium]